MLKNINHKGWVYISRRESINNLFVDNNSEHKRNKSSKSLIFLAYMNSLTNLIDLPLVKGLCFKRSIGVPLRTKDLTRGGSIKFV